MPASRTTIELSSPASDGVDLLIVAGEHSGDQHAAALVRDLLAHQPEMRIAALGGENLKAAGVQLLFDLVEHSVIGFVEVVRHYGFFKELFEKTVAWIKLHRPRAVLFVDYPGFNLRLAKRLVKEGIGNKGGGSSRLLYYISPQVWAWKKHRRFAMAEYLDGLAVIFPFEREVFADTALPVSFVGHPFLREDYTLPVGYDAEGPLLLLPGSRRKPVERIAPPFIEAFAEVRKTYPDLTARILYPDTTVREALERVLEHFEAVCPAIELAEVGEPTQARAVLTSSGTMSLNCALAAIPGAIAYRAHPLSYWIARTFVTIRHIGIANLLLDRSLYPEYIQFAATGENLAARLREVLASVQTRKEVLAGAEELRHILGDEKDDEAWKWVTRNLD